MTKREKVIKALECRLDINGSKYKHCLNCDYRHDIDHCQWACQTDGILEDALALLKAQEPRVMTIEELRGYSGPVWVEWRDERYAYENGWEVATFTEEYAADDETYNGKDYRYWTSRPTDEQREAVKWE